MFEWYNSDHYCLTNNGKYSVSLGYLKMIGDRPKLETAESIWNKVAMPEHRFIL